MSLNLDELVAVAKEHGASDGMAKMLGILLMKAYELGIEEEREACANVCEMQQTFSGVYCDCHYAIRALNGIKK